MPVTRVVFDIFNDGRLVGRFDEGVCTDLMGRTVTLKGRATILDIKTVFSDWSYAGPLTVKTVK